MKNVIKSGACALVMSVIATSAFAGEPKQSTSVTAATFTGLSFKDNFSDDGYTAYLGIEECRSAMDADSRVLTKFTTSVSLSSVDISGNSLFQGAYLYSVERGASSGSACTTTSTTCRQLTDAYYTISSQSIDLDVKFKELTELTSTEDCNSGEVDQEHFIQITYNSDSTSSTTQLGELRVVVDTKRPTAPDSFEALATESAIQITWVDESPASDRAGYGVFYSTTAFEGGVAPDQVSGLQLAGNISATSSDRTTGEVQQSLTANSDIYIAIATRDEAGNYSVLTEPQIATVLDTIDFWEAYKASGGDEEGGYCAQASPGRGRFGGELVWLGVLGLGVFGRRRLKVRPQ